MMMMMMMMMSSTNHQLVISDRTRTKTGGDDCDGFSRNVRVVSFARRLFRRAAPARSVASDGVAYAFGGARRQTAVALTRLRATNTHRAVIKRDEHLAHAPSAERVPCPAPPKIPLSTNPPTHHMVE